MSESDTDISEPRTVHEQTWELSFWSRCADKFVGMDIESIEVVDAEFVGDVENGDIAIEFEVVEE